MKTTYTGHLTHPHRIFSIYGRPAFLVGTVSVLVCLPIRAGEQPAEVARGTGRHTLQDQSLVEAYRQALFLNPDDRLACISLGWLFYVQGRWPGAIDQYRLAIEHEVDADAQ